MFEAVNRAPALSKQDFEAEVQEVRTELLKVQYALQETDISVIIIIAGVEGAGKSDVVNRFNEWMDTRWIRNHAFWDETDEERQRPAKWRFWRIFPPRGQMAVLFGSWYTHHIINCALGKTSGDHLDVEMQHIEQLERMLTDDNHLVVKLWFHLSPEMQQKRIKGKDKHRLTKLAKKFSKHYDDFLHTSERAIRLTDTGNAPWFLINAEQERYRDITAAKILLQQLQATLKKQTDDQPAPAKQMHARRFTLDSPTVLDELNLDECQLSKKAYKQQLDHYQQKLSKLGWQARDARRSVVCVFEGWDAGGKGGAIRRVTRALDARLYSVISVAAPTDEERARHYLWRFWRQLPRDGYITIYDRSWYGRVLVERIEGLATEEEWMRSYQEINDFEEQQYLHGTVVTKFWLHISADEQLRRFEERQATPWKQHKITDEDWRNRENWDLYAAAVNDMVARTSTNEAPWIIVPANDKKYARIHILKTLCQRIEAALER